MNYLNQDLKSLCRFLLFKFLIVLYLLNKFAYKSSTLISLFINCLHIRHNSETYTIEKWRLKWYHFSINYLIKFWEEYFMKLKRLISIFCIGAMCVGVMASCSNKPNNSSSSASGTDTAGSTASDSATNDDVSPVPPSSPVEFVTGPETDNIETVDAEFTKAFDIEAFKFTIFEDRLYYIDYGDDFIYSVDLEGKDKKEVVKEASSYIEFTDDGKLLYCIDYVKDMVSNTFTVNPDGTDKVDKNELRLDVYGMTTAKTSDGKVVYDYMDESGDNAGLYISDEGQDPDEGEKFLPGVVDSFCLVDDKAIVSLNLIQGIGIYRCDLKGENLVKLFDESANDLTYYKDIVYFINLSDNKIYQMSKASALKG